MLKGELQGAIRETIQGENQEALLSVLSRLLQGALKGPTNRFQLKCFQGHFKEHLREYFQEHFMEQFKKQFLGLDLALVLKLWSCILVSVSSQRGNVSRTC